jgi:predicted nucleic acid-binding protein
MIHVIDAGPMIAFLKGEQGGQIVAKIFIDHPGQCFAHVFNLTEVYYVFYRSAGANAAEAAIQALLTVGVIPREDADTAFWKDAAMLKGKHPLALPDAFCLALARRLSGITVTTDHAEFDSLVPLGYCHILFVR